MSPDLHPFWYIETDSGSDYITSLTNDVRMQTGSCIVSLTRDYQLLKSTLIDDEWHLEPYEPQKSDFLHFRAFPNTPDVKRTLALIKITTELHERYRPMRAILTPLLGKHSVYQPRTSVVRFKVMEGPDGLPLAYPRCCYEAPEIERAFCELLGYAAGCSAPA